MPFALGENYSADRLHFPPWRAILLSAIGHAGDLRELASQRLAALLQAAKSAGDYRWNSGARRFNLGLFRGLAGVGYTSLRRLDGSLPNILIWE